MAWAVGAWLVAGAAACSLLAPSGESLSSAYREDAGAAPARDAGPSVDSTPDAACPVGTKACGGACVSVSSTATGCATASCEPCPELHAGSLCIGGACAVGPCENGWANCNQRADDGCEVDTRASAQFCGSCLNSCGDGTPRCEQGQCVPRCGAIKLTSAGGRALLPGEGMAFGEGDFTVELWIQRHTDFAASKASLFTSNSVNAEGAIVIVGDLTSLHCSVNTSTSVTFPSVPLPSDLAWHHFACARRAGTLTLYLDGTPAAQQVNSRRVLGGGAAAIGQIYANYQALPALIGPMRVSRSSRYGGAFVPRTFWLVDSDTVAQFLTGRAFDGSLTDEVAKSSDAGAPITSIVSTTNTPCP